MFIGEYHHSVDQKGRLAIPVKFREILTYGAVVTRGLDHCLFLYPVAEWNKLAEKISQLPMSQATSRAFSRLMLAGAMDVQVDKQGRVIVPDYLRKYANLGKQIVVVGLYNRLEIWDSEEWKKYKTTTEKDGNEIAETLGTL